MRTIRMAYACTLMLALAMRSISPATAGDAEPLTGKVAMVNGAEITSADFQSELSRVRRMRGLDKKEIKPAELAVLKKEVMASLISRELLYQESRKKGIKVADAAVAGEMAELKQQFATGIEFRETLDRMGLSEPAIKAQVERGMAIQKFIDAEFAAKVEIREDEVRNYYDSHPADFKKPLRVRVSHILLKTAPGWDVARKTAARGKLETIRRKFLQGEDFATLAREHSECLSSKKGGDLGWFGKGQIAKPLEKVVFAMNPGEVSDIVEDKFGLHLIRLVELQPEAITPYEQVRDRIGQQLRRDKAMKNVPPYVKKLRDKARVELMLVDEEG